MKVVGLFSVLQNWRVGYFIRLIEDYPVKLTVVHGEDVPGTKRINTKASVPFHRILLAQQHFMTGVSGNKAPLVFFKGLWPTLNTERPDVLLLEGASNIANALVAILWAKVSKVPVVWWTLGELPGRKYSFLGRLFRRVVAIVERRCDVLMLYSSQALSYTDRIGIPRHKCVVAVNVIETEKATAEAVLLIPRRQQIISEIMGKVTPLVVYVGALATGKGLEALPDLFSRVREEVPNARLLVVGDGGLRGALESSFRSNGCEDVVLFVGEKTKDVGRYLVCGDVFLMPGLGGLAISHSMSYGVPVVCSSGDGVEADLVVNGETGFLCTQQNGESTNDECMVHACATILKSPELREKLSRNALVAVTERHTGAKMVESMYSALTLAREGRGKK